MGLSGTVTIQIQTDLTKQLDLAPVDSSLNPLQRIFTFIDGTGIGKINQQFHDTREILTGANDDIQLTTAGGLIDAVGDPVNFARIKLIYISAAKANDADLEVGGHPTAAFDTWVKDSSDILLVKPDQVNALMSDNGTDFVVIATTADILRITHGSSNTLTYDIVLLGEKV